MDKTAIIVSAMIGSLGVLGALLGFIAEGAATYVSTLLSSLFRSYRFHP
jgi:hypothetical protein